MREAHGRGGQGRRKPRQRKSGEQRGRDDVPQGPHWTPTEAPIHGGVAYVGTKITVARGTMLDRRRLADPLSHDLVVEAPAMFDPTALRVARRHAQEATVVPLREVPTTTRLDFGTVFGIELKLLLEPKVGYLVRLRFRAVPGGPPSTVAWEAVAENGKLVTGRLALGTTVAENEVAAWGEVTVDH
jgi:hypothetical protein